MWFLLIKIIIIAIVFNSDLSLFKAIQVMIGRFDQSKLFALVLFFRHEIDVRKFENQIKIPGNTKPRVM